MRKHLVFATRWSYDLGKMMLRTQMGNNQQKIHVCLEHHFSSFCARGWSCGGRQVGWVVARLLAACVRQANSSHSSPAAIKNSAPPREAKNRGTIICCEE